VKFNVSNFIRLTEVKKERSRKPDKYLMRLHWYPVSRPINLFAARQGKKVPGKLIFPARGLEEANKFQNFPFSPASASLCALIN
jgi:hypothetical protein